MTACESCTPVLGLSTIESPPPSYGCNQVYPFYMLNQPQIPVNTQVQLSSYCDGCVQWPCNNEWGPWQFDNWIAVRNSYLGDPTSCCLAQGQGANAPASYNTTGNTSLLTLNNLSSLVGALDQNLNAQYTCNPDLVTTSLCVPLITAFATQLTNFGEWAQGGVLDTFFTNGGNYIDLATEAISGISQAVLSQYSLSDSDPVISSTISSILNWCSEYPSPGTDTAMETACLYYQREDVSQAATNVDQASKNIVAACGCHLPTSQYNEYSGIIPETVYNECDPLCKLTGSIPKYNAPACASTNCVLDNITFDLVNSDADINFSQACAGCSSGNCDCYIGDVSVFSSGSSVDLNFLQNCSRCFTYSESDPGNPVQVACSAGTPLTFWERVTSWFQVNRGKVIMTLLIVGILIAIGIGIYFYEKERR